MAKSKTTPTTISVQVNGVYHTVEVTSMKKEYHVSINGQSYRTFGIGKNSSFGIHHEDFPIEVQGKGFILAVRGSSIRLAKDGQYIDNGETFSPAKPPPKWVWIFVVLNAALFFVVAGGAIGGGFAAGGAFGCISVTRSGNSTTKKLILCLLITLGCWIGAALLAGIVLTLL